MLTTSEIKRISNLETKKQARLSMCEVGGIGQPRTERFGAACRTVHSQNVSCNAQKCEKVFRLVIEQHEKSNLKR
jgi:hypothetical protein